MVMLVVVLATVMMLIDNDSVGDDHNNGANMTPDNC